MELSSEVAEQLNDSMQREAVLLKEFALTGERIMKDLSDMNWIDLQIHLEASQKISTVIETTEHERDRLYKKFRGHCGVVESANFYQVVRTAAPRLQTLLIKQFRELKLALLQAQGVSWKIEMYVASAGGTMKELLNHIFPHRKGTMYSKQGVLKEADSNPLVLNREL